MFPLPLWMYVKGQFAHFKAWFYIGGMKMCVTLSLFNFHFLHRVLSVPDGKILNGLTSILAGVNFRLWNNSCPCVGACVYIWVSVWVCACVLVFICSHVWGTHILTSTWDQKWPSGVFLQWLSCLLFQKECHFSQSLMIQLECLQWFPGILLSALSIGITGLWTIVAGVRMR